MRLLHRSDSLVTSRRMARFSSLKLRCEFASEVELGDAVSATKRKGHKRNAELKNPVIIKNSLWLYCSQAFVKFGSNLLKNVPIDYLEHFLFSLIVFRIVIWQKFWRFEPPVHKNQTNFTLHFILKRSVFFIQPNCFYKNYYTFKML